MGSSEVQQPAAILLRQLLQVAQHHQRTVIRRRQFDVSQVRHRPHSPPPRQARKGAMSRSSAGRKIGQA